MAITPNTNFTSGAVYTAAQANAFPRGVMGLQTLTTSFTTSATHTTFQDNGMTLTFTEETGRIYRITAYSNLYPIGTLQGVNIQLLRSATALKQANFSSTLMDTGTAYALSFTFVYTSTASGSATFKIRICGNSSNTQVADYADATFPRQFVIEDIGAS